MPTLSSYYSNINTELLDICPAAERVIEFGCGAGRFLGAYKEYYPDAHCTGFEKFTEAASEAANHCDHVLTGDAEQASDYSSLIPASFDLIIYGYVLEHFLDPWGTIKAHLLLLKPGGTICACIPNVSHWSIIFSLINGQFEYKDSGLLDRTHLRFFTKASIQKMVSEAGLTLDFIRPRKFHTPNTNDALHKLAKLFDKSAHDISSDRITDWATYQYLVKATKEPV